MEPNFCKNLAEMGSKVLRGLNQKSGYIRISGIWSSNSCKNNHGKILIVAEVTTFRVTDTLEKIRIEIWPLAIYVAFWRLNGYFLSD